MFRKPKRKAKAGLRRKISSDEEDGPSSSSNPGATNETNELLAEAKKRLKSSAGSAKSNSSADQHSSASLMHSFDAAKSRVTAAELATSTVQHLPEQMKSDNEEKVGKGADGIFRNKQRNKFHAGPIKASQNIRVTARFDYEPSICKDYKETGFCGFGDTCIYLHDRGDTLTGWQLEQQWEEQQKKKKEQQEREIQGFMDGMSGKEAGDEPVVPVGDDGLPFACFLCRKPFENPVVTTCNHYFCESCIMRHVRDQIESCPVCAKDTGSVFNQPTKLLAKRRKVLGLSASKKPDAWEKFAEAMSSKTDD